MGETTFGDVAYRVYVTTLLSLFAVFTASGWIGDDTVSASTTHDIVRDAPAWLGLLAALAVLGGVRTGSRGGPLAIEAADVQHMLLAPVDRRAVLRRPVSRSVGSALLWGALGGALAGDLAGQRLPGDGLAWIASGALAGATAAVLTVGAALLVAGRGPRSSRSSWRSPSAGPSPTSRPRRAPRRCSAASLRHRLRRRRHRCARLAIALVGTAFATIGSLSIEAARRSTALSGDSRSRSRTPLHRARPALPTATRRCVHAVPPLRRARRTTPRPRAICRTSPAGYSCARRAGALGGDRPPAQVWSGTTPLVVAGLASFVAALDDRAARTSTARRASRPFPAPTGGCSCVTSSVRPS
jgi:hypothetical protein